MEAVERPQIPVGKLDVRQVFLPSAAATEEKVPILVGKLDTRNLFPAVGVDASSPDEQPAVTVGKLDTRNLFSAAEVASWDGARLSRAIIHDQSCPDFNPHVRQLFHVAFKLAAEAGPKFTDLLKQHNGSVGDAVTGNLWERHLKPLFL